MHSDLQQLHHPLDPEIHQPAVLDPATFRHQPEVFQDIRITPFTPVVGGTVEGFSLKEGETVSEPVRNFLKQSLLKYGFLSFVPGSVQESSFENFSYLFGSPRFAGNPQAPRAGSGEVNAIDSSHKKTRTNYIWHIDQAYRPGPQNFTALHAVKAPGFGGETIFSDATAAYRLLDPKLAAWFDTLNLINNGDQMGLISMSYREPALLHDARQKTPPLLVPLVRVHPETGVKQLFSCELYAQRVTGLPRIVSDHVLHIVFEYLRSPEVLAQYHWQDGATLIWDNRIVHHRGVFNYGGQERVLHRAVID